MPGWTELPIRLVLPAVTTNHKRARGRELRVAEDVARLLSAAVIAQMEAVVDDPDNVCFVCDRFISGPSAELAVFAEGSTVCAWLAHPECAESGVRALPGLGQAVVQRFAAGSESHMATLLGLRQPSPRALLFLEPSLTVCGWGGDPLETFAAMLGLPPASGAIDRIAPEPTDLLSIRRLEHGLALRHPFGADFAPASRSELDQWWDASGGEALVVVARGLGLSRSQPTIEEALQFRQAWAAVAPLEDFVPSPRRRGVPQRLARKLFQSAQLPTAAAATRSGIPSCRSRSFRQFPRSWRP